MTLLTTTLPLILLSPLCLQGGQGRSVASPIADAQTIKITRAGSEPSRSGPAENFTGSVRVDYLFQPNEPSRTSGAFVTFEPAARTAWHKHPLGQILIVTAGARLGSAMGRSNRGDPAG
jgi:quercetin dioxygenase-like cupin family protein